WRHDLGRIVGTHDGVGRQRHRVGRASHQRRPDRPSAVAHRPSGADGQPDGGGAKVLPFGGARQCRLDRRDFCRTDRAGRRYADAPLGKSQGFGPQGDRPRRRHMSGFGTAHVADTLGWPFFDENHRRFAADLARWADVTLPSLPHDDVDAACRARVAAFGDAGFLKAVVPDASGDTSRLDVRTIALARDILAFRDGLADFAFTMQGLGTGAITLFGSPELKARYLPPVRAGRAIAAFALTEPDAGSDVAALATRATVDGPAHVRLDGTKTFISNGGIANHYVVFARSGEG